MVVGRDFDLAGGVVAHRVIAAVVPEFQFVGLPSQGETGKLMAKADSKHRDAAEELLNGADGVIDRFGIAGAVGEEDAVGLEF